MKLVECNRLCFAFCAERPWNCLNEARILFVIFEGAANLAYRMHQIVFRDEGVSPDRFKEFLLFYGPAAVLYQEYQSLE